MLLSIAYYMLITHRKHRCNPLHFKWLEGNFRHEVGLFECEVGLFEYGGTPQMGLFEYGGFSSGNWTVGMSLSP